MQYLLRLFTWRMRMRNLDEYAAKVWSVKSVQAKRKAMIEMIDAMTSDLKKTRYKEMAASMAAHRLDKFAANLMLRDTDQVV